MSSVVSPSHREQLHAQLDQILDSLDGRLSEAESVEEMLERRMRKLAGQTLQAWADDASKADGAPRCAACDQPMRHLGCPVLRLETTLGLIRVRRPRRRCPTCGREAYLHDAALRLGGHAISWRLARLATRLCARHPFEEAQQLLEEDYQIALSKQTLELVIQHAGEVLLSQDDTLREAFFSLPPKEQQARQPAGEHRPHLVAIGVDGTKMHTEDDWKEIRVGRVTAQDGDGVRLAQKSFARFLSVEEVGRQLFLDAQQVGYAYAQQRVMLGDGAAWIWELAAELFPEAVCVLDWYHLSEKVHEAAGQLHGAGSEEAQRWAKEVRNHLWEGRGADARKLVLAQRKRVRSAAKREALRTLHGYLKNNASRMDYPAYRAAGLPVGSGMIESHCKWLVTQRCKGSGMRNWKQRNAESVLRFRCALTDGDFHHLWNEKLQIAA